MWGDHVYLVNVGKGYAPSAKLSDGCTWTTVKYDTGLGTASFTDEYCDGVLATCPNSGKSLAASFKRIGRGEGLYDRPALKLFGNIDPMDVSQGSLGDCWLMCSMSAVAEFDGLMQNLFEEADINAYGK